MQRRQSKLLKIHFVKPHSLQASKHDFSLRFQTNRTSVTLGNRAVLRAAESNYRAFSGAPLFAAAFLAEPPDLSCALRTPAARRDARSIEKGRSCTETRKDSSGAASSVRSISSLIISPSLTFLVLSKTSSAANNEGKVDSEVVIARTREPSIRC